MKVLMLTWEFPPRTVGGLARHVAGLSQALGQEGWEVEVITPGEAKNDSGRPRGGVSLHPVQPYALPSLNFITDIQHLNYSLLEEAVRLINASEDIALLHAHDWLVAFAARALKHIYRLPLVCTIHATEYGRNQGLHSELQHYISSVEWWLTYESWRVIVCSQSMKDEVGFIFQTPADKMRVIPNAIELSEFTFDPQKAPSRQNFALPEEKIVFYIGRMVPEKGVQTLLQAVPGILREVPEAKFILAGKGPYEEELKRMSREMGLEHKVQFIGYIEDTVRNALYNYAELAVFPSLYEPFGIVALEGMATKTPVVVSDTGGLREIVKHEKNGLLFPPGDGNALARQIIRLLKESGLAKRLAENAYHYVLRDYTWSGVAQKTLGVYQEILEESGKSQWQPYFVNKINANDVLGRYDY